MGEIRFVTSSQDRHGGTYIAFDKWRFSDYDIFNKDTNGSFVRDFYELNVVRMQLHDFEDWSNDLCKVHHEV